jgi:hypothetical protein
MGVEEFSFILFYFILKKEEFQVITTLLKLHIVFSNKLFCLFFLSHVNEEFKLRVLISPLLFIRLAAPFQDFLIFLFLGGGAMGHFTTKNKLKPHRLPQKNTSFYEDGMPSLWLIYIGEKRRTLDKGYGIK